LNTIFKSQDQDIHAVLTLITGASTPNYRLMK